MSLRSDSYRVLARRLLLATWLVMAPIVKANVVGAQPSEAQIDRAREQFRRGVGLEAAGDWAGALVQFEAVARVKMTHQVRFHIARCHYHLGKLLEALGGYRLAAHEAAQDPKGVETLAEARKGIEKVEAEIPKLLIERGVGAEAASVRLDGVDLGDRAVGKEVPVNPGAHTVEFTLPDGRSEQRIARVKEGDTKRVMLTASFVNDHDDPSSDMKDKGGTQESGRVLPWVALGVGGAGLLTSGIFYFMRSSTIADHDEQCIDNVCPRSLENTGNKGKTYGTVGAVTFGVGLLGLGIGTLMLVSDHKAEASARSEVAKRERTAPRMMVVVGSNGQGAEASLVGTF